MPGNIPYRNLIFIPVFFSFYIVLKTFGTPDLSLTSFGGRPVSMATAEGIDVAARVGLFYKGLIFLVFLLYTLTRITLIAQRFIPREEMQLMNGLSLAAFCLLFYRLLGAEIRPSLHVIFGLLAMVATGSLFHKMRKRETINFQVALLWSAMMATSLFFLQWQLSKFLSLHTFLSLPLTLLIFGSALYFLSTNRFTINYRILKATFPFVLLPLLSFGSMEDTMIFNQHNIFVSPAVFYFIGLLGLIIYAFYAYRKSEGIHSGIPHEIRLFRTWVPWMLAGLFCMAFYLPVVHADVDIYESANNILPLQQWFNFGRLPLIDTFNAHALADFAPGWLYSIFNGHDPMGYYVYRFLVQVVVLISVYILVYKMSGDGLLAIWLTLAYPYVDHLIPSYFNLVPIPVIAFIRIYEKQTTSRYFIYFLSIIFMILWRIDLGMAVLIAGVLSLLFLIFFVPAFETNRRALRRALIYSIVLSAIIFLVAWVIAGMDIFVSMKDVLGYLSSAQSYGRLELATQTNLEFYSLYFVLPSVIILILAVTIYNVRTAHFSGNTVLAALAIIFLALFYFANFQRGLIRHTLYEQWNNALTSYGFFIISAYILILIHKQNYESKFLIFFIVSTLLVANYFYQEPDLKTNNNYYTLSDKLYNSQFINSTKEKINRIVQDPAIAASYSEFKEFMDKNYPKSTFIDFSNTPMIYYYTNREMPGYFLQPPQTAHNEYLQKRFIEDLSKYDVPVLVFSNVPGNFWDNLDGIPNAMRHYRIAEYLYQNYEPAYNMSGHSVWMKSVSYIPPPLPFHWQSFEIDTLVLGKTYVNPPLKFKSPIGHRKLTARIRFNSKYTGDLTFYFKTTVNSNIVEFNRQIHFSEGQNDFFIQLNELNDSYLIDSIRFESGSAQDIKKLSIDVLGDDHFRDNYSEQAATHALKWIPFIWGKYYMTYNSSGNNVEYTLLNKKTVMEKGDSQSVVWNTLFLPNKHGNYLKVSLKSTSLNIPVVNINYGSSVSSADPPYSSTEISNGGFAFNLKNDSTYHDYFIRISSQYNWYAKKNNSITITSSENCEIKSAEILEGD